MTNDNPDSIFASYFAPQKSIKLNGSTSNFQKKTNAFSIGPARTDLNRVSPVQQSTWTCQSATVSKQADQASGLSQKSTSPANAWSWQSIKTDAWSEDDRSNMRLYRKSLSSSKTTCFSRGCIADLCSPPQTSCYVGLVIGCLVVGVALAVIVTMWLYT
ncbi:unnamed protein product, partial [Rotaria socialis]